jgi:ATP-dependent DNA ligase
MEVDQECLRSAHGGRRHAFDALIYRGRSLLGLSLDKRRNALAAALADIEDPVEAAVTLNARSPT